MRSIARKHGNGAFPVYPPTVDSRNRAPRGRRLADDQRRKRHEQDAEAGEDRPQGHGAQRLGRQAGRLLRSRGARRRVRLEDVQGNAVELEGNGLFPAPAGPALYREQAGRDPGRLRLGHDLQRERGHGQRRGRGLRRLALGDLRAAGLENPRTEGSEGHSDLGRPARRQPFQRALPAGEVPPARAHQDGEHRRLRRAAEGAAGGRSRGREPVAAADRHGRAARPAQSHRGPLPYALVGARATPRPTWCRAT